ncbi:hypothetical protein B5S28_g3384 [[Candida] boidinii]|uniref:Unnamed protein product n=1 Tax=Candida boidinii TaxID=5477 RepID=A0ACB5TGJ2_CANBO|nr:hypothetical protein B5S28_g3384 [[Candida] boidinii]OWB64242.1 hypothetical protein B5S29_g5299 [[Candida] boidinii]OWB75435.1 hypothetical protein B5S31_g5335 [[Candida] boidinii]OWB80097.1 hypothetical protein B5S32_g4348 [[Candida] boidinii]GME73264.1 unnamed protein product [[Candida] boidinii]
MQIQLYGGGMTVELPEGVIDASEFREVPDTQEVYVTASNNTEDYNSPNKEDSIITDLLEKVDSVSNDESILFHLNEIAKLNGDEEGKNWKLLFESKVQPKNFTTDPSYLSIAVQPAKKWGRDKDSTTLVLIICLIRIERVQTDFLITYNIPISSKKELEDLKILENLKAGDDKIDNLAYKRISYGKKVVDKMIETIKIVHWDLFGEQ